ncbi:TPA: hypothetical protein QIB48_000001 [Morganella morganii subsp. morganii]|nr:hypothetical protein [Morganella morganii subsp. morganii]
MKNEDGSRNDPQNLMLLEKRLGELINDDYLDPNFIEDGIRYGYFTVDGKLSNLAKRRLIKLAHEYLN